MRAVRYGDYGDASVLRIDDVPEPIAASSQVVVEVKATGINPAETKIRGGIMRERSPLTFPASQGSEFSGIVAAVGDAVTRWSVGDQVLGWSRTQDAQAEFVAVEAADLMRKPENVSFEVAGSVVAVGCTAWSALDALAPAPDDTVAVSGAGGGIGSVVVQLMRQRRSVVFGIASAHHHERLHALGAVPILPEEFEHRVPELAPKGLNTFIDTVGEGYVERALELGVAPARIHTVIDFPAVDKYGVSGGAASASIDVIAKTVAMLAAGTLILRVAATYPLEQVELAYEHLATGHPGGKIVLLP